ncbi:MAG: hypothetical protein GY719_41455 [bacterium]|nr:hypothetical protein [bacterium]
MHPDNTSFDPPTADRHPIHLDAERPFIDLLERALELPVDQRHAFVRAHSHDLAMFDAAMQCLATMGELDESF